MKPVGNPLLYKQGADGYRWVARRRVKPQFGRRVARKNKALRETGLYELESLVDLNAERGTAATGTLHVRVLELEARAFERLDVVDGDALEIHQ
jgi:hypothetical protein